MGKHRDLVGILIIVIIGMFIPFLGSIMINYGFNYTNIGDWLKIGSTFGYFLLIFGVELIVVYLYFSLSNKIANKKLKEYKPKS
jgi:hypothetical protein